VDYIIKLVALNKYDKAAQKELMSEVEAMQPLPNKHWFIEQLE